VFNALERRGVRVVRHPKNLGKGSALKTAIVQARLAFPNMSHLISVDADGQHLPDDVLRVWLMAQDKPQALVLGARDLQSRQVPLRSQVGNAFSALYFKMDTGVTCPDTQTGLRAIPRALLPLAMRTSGCRYEYEMNFLTAMAKRDVPLEMVPIAAVYERGNAGSHFSTVRDSLRIYRQFIRFAGSSLACSAVDLGVFALMVAILGLESGALVAAATFVARLFSGALNFEVNRTWSFADSGSRKGPADVQAIRYGVLFIAQMLASMTLVTLLSVLPLPLVLVKALVDGSLFFVSHFIQKNWVFKAGARSIQPGIVKGGMHARSARAA
jgi:putative flippase GtrA